jgi:DNA-directed RNA polymerase subunit M/transcription elongation factor TFIIS
VLIKNNKFGWGHEQFNYVSNLINEQNDFIKNPFEVEEGIFQCKAFIKETGKICGSRRVYSYAKQDRSSDEGTSVYAQCMNCGCKWRERG